jgi:ATP-dependent Clp protease adaptor protein ClpS
MSDIDIVEDIKLDEKLEKKIEEPSKYKVIMLNDDQTPMDWVIGVLKNIFKHSQETAEKIMLTIHSEGSGLVGVYTFEIAEQKSNEAVVTSRENGFPLTLKMEKE